MFRKISLCVGLALASQFATAQNGSGAEKGVPFKDVQQLINAANDVLAAAVSANTANIEANAAAIDAEEAARVAEDAALLAKFAADIAAEALARLEGDASLAQALAAEEIARLAAIDFLGTRVDALESGSGGAEGGSEYSRELVYTETAGYDLAVLRDDLYTLDYQPGEWLYMASTYAPSGLRSALCTSDPQAYTVVSAYALGGAMAASLGFSSTYVLQEGQLHWTQRSAAMLAQPTTLLATATGMTVGLIDRNATNSSTTAEINARSGYNLDNEAVIRAAASREEACGF